MFASYANHHSKLKISLLKDISKKKYHLYLFRWYFLDFGIFLSFHVVSNVVLSAFESLTSVFEMGTGGSSQLLTPKILCYIRHTENCIKCNPDHVFGIDQRKLSFGSSPRPISTGQLNTLLCLHLQPINLVFYKGPYLHKGVGNLILGWASRLDAFSAYPVRTQLPSCAAGATTGTPLVRPSRSSRTKDSSPQISCARDG